ncbi:MAG: bifunctional hydroxymethylpyrimidine kinase/phosphomethylpyrimidine kinase [Halanaerobiales bacterium]
MKKVLTIAGSDSGGGAGIQADLKTMTIFKTYGASVITAVTAQNTLGVQGVNTLNGDFVLQQLDSVLSDIEFSAVKTGMLANREIVEIVAEKIKEYDLLNLVVDPVMAASSGDLLLEKDAVAAYKNSLFPLAHLITPNLPEAKILLGKDIEEEVNLKKLAEELYKLGSKNVLIKGGHEKSSNHSAVDLLYDGNEFVEYRAEFIDTTNTHGTGCTLSSAIASNLAKGLSVKKAVEISKKYITKAIRSGFLVGEGNNPVNHFVDF